MKGDFFYSKTTGLYVARKPLTIDARVKEAAEKAHLNTEWDDEGRINFLDFDTAKKLLFSLGSCFMSPVEYWKVMADAAKENDKDMLHELTSDRYCEWLDRVFLAEKTYIDHPEIVSSHAYAGEKKEVEYPIARPGWFNPENNIDFETGIPKQVVLSREKFATSWKFWAPDFSITSHMPRAPIRGYVTSVGKPSLDMGIPVDALQPKQMIRECRYTPLTPVIDEQILGQAHDILYSKNVRAAIDFVEKQGKLFAGSTDSFVYKLREAFFDLLGSVALEQDISKASRELAPAGNKSLAYDDFADFVKSSESALEKAVNSSKDLVFVMGHKNPDTDTVISCLFEAWRNHLADGKKVTYVPVVQSTRIPDEVRQLVGELSGQILLTTNFLYQQAKSSGLARWISVDQNREPEVQKYFVTIIDHHIVSEVARNRDIPKTLEMTGSSTALVTRKYLGMGYDFSKELAKILYGAALMDTENRVEHKMTDQDIIIMDYLKKKSGVESNDALYQELMSRLLNTDDADSLFLRDYKEDWGFGFAVAKIKGGFSEKGDILKPKMVSRMHELAMQNNINKNLPLTLLKITDYQDNNETVNRERIYFLFNQGASPEFIATTRKALEAIIRFEFNSDKLEICDDHIDFWGGGMQLSRKKTAPVLEPVVKAFNNYFYSPTINRWVKRDFIKNTQIVKDAYPGLSTDAEGRINYITYPEVKELAKRLGLEILSLNEYWKVLLDAKKIKDVQMINSLQGSNFVEFLDTAIIDNAYLIDHPVMAGENLQGEKKPVTVLRGKPGLIHPDEIDLETGLPIKVRPPNEYCNPALWRYWEPDAKLVFPCRSYIFLLDQPCWDGKFHLHDSFPNLGFRPVIDHIRQPEVSLSWDDSYLTVNLFAEKENKIFKWPKKISDYPGDW
jgi:inorganic pyrophosphatase/exopolyphosphatase